jgi:hypothetical protein
MSCSERLDSCPAWERAGGDLLRGRGVLVAQEERYGRERIVSRCRKAGSGVIDVREDSGKAPTPMRRARGSNARELPYIRILSALRSRNT